jgi:4-azaleucine resistance transporter AzlC
MRRDLREDVPALTDAPPTDAITGGSKTPGPRTTRSAVDEPLAASRRQLVLDGLGILGSAAGFGLVFGVSAGAAGYSPLEVAAMGILVFAGAAQFAGVGYVASGVSWPAIVLLTAFLNARHLLYSAALAPYVAHRRRLVRAAMAHLLTDEAFALSIAHFRRVGRADLWGYWYGAIVTTFVPWNVASLAGVLVGRAVPPRQLGLDVVFPAAMAGLAVGLVTGRRELAAALSGALIAVGVSLAWDPAAGTIAGGLIGPLVGLAVPIAPGRDVAVDPAHLPVDPLP